MASRKPNSKNSSLLALALNKDWFFSLIIATVILLVTLLIPLLLQKTVFFVAVSGLQSIGLFFSGIFLVISIVKGIVQLISFLKRASNTQQQNSDKQIVTPTLSSQHVVIAGSASNLETAVKKAKVWSLDLIQAIEWRLFEELCYGVFIQKGYQASKTPLGKDGGIDIQIFSKETNDLIAIAQCKSWSQKVGVKSIREFIGVMKHEAVNEGFYMTSSTFTEDATQLAEQNGLRLIDGQQLLKLIQKLDPASQETLYDQAVVGDYRTPSCPSCGIKMVRRKSAKGDFWGCSTFPSCKQRLKLRTVDAVNKPANYWQY